MSVTELPLHSFFQRSLSFCNSVRTDLDQFIQLAEDEFSSINREVKIAPKLRRKSRLVDFPGTCTFDLKEFSRSKEKALRSLKTNFEDMEMKWATDVAELKGWFLSNVESCLSKIQLEIKVTAEDLNLPKHACESDLQEENSSSSSEISVITDTEQSTSQYYSLSPPAARTTNKNAKTPGRVQARKATTVTEPAVRSKKCDWMSLLGATEKAPSKPGIYEIKVWRAKNPAYIGHSDDLQQSLLQYREGKVSREKQKKHLNLFIQRNKGEISVKYEVYPSVQLAKQEQKKRLKEFLEKNKNLPSYNYGL